MDGESEPAGAAPRNDKVASTSSASPRSPSPAEVPADTIDIQEMSRRFGVSYRTLHYYEQLELLSPVRRGRWRHYRPRDFIRLTLILNLRRFGFRLEEIRQWLLIYDREGEERQLLAWRAMAERQSAKLERQRDDLARAIDELRKLSDVDMISMLVGEPSGPLPSASKPPNAT